MRKLPSAVKRIRMEKRLRIGAFTSEVLGTYCPGLHEETLQSFCQPFQQ